MKKSSNNSVVPQIRQLTFPTIKALKALGGSGSVQEIEDKVIEIESIPEEIQKVMLSDNGKTTLSYRMSWARNYLKHAGAVANSGHGVWALTETGAGLSKEQGENLVADVRKREAEAKKKKAVEPESGSLEDEGKKDWKDELLGVLMQMKPDAFERLAKRLLREKEFIKVDVTGKSGDGGIDGVGVLRVNLLSFKVFFQCKRYKGSVGSGEIRDFRGAMQGRCDKGLFITTGSFTADAKREATRDGAHAVDLIDGQELCDLLKSLGLGVRTEVVESVAVQADWFAAI